MRKHDSKQMLLWLGLLLAFVALWLLPARADGQTLAEAAAAVDECVEKAELRQLVKPVATVTGLEASLVEKALSSGGLKVSELVYVKTLVAKTGQTPAKVLEKPANRDWVAELKKAGVSEEELLQILDDAYADLALKMMDLPGKRKALKPTAKR